MQIKSKVLLSIFLLSIFLISGCVNQAIINSFQKKYGGEINSLKFDIKSTTYSNTFKVCSLGESGTDCKPKSFSNFDNLEKINMDIKKLSIKKPDKYFMITESNDYIQGKTDHEIGDLCTGSISEIWDSNYPKMIIKETGFSCNNFINLISSNNILTIARRISNLRAKVTKTTLDGREVIEVYKKEKRTSPDIETEFWMYFDAKDYTPIKEIEINKEIFDKLIDGNEVTHIRYRKTITEYRLFEINNVLNSEFVLPKEIKDLGRCSFTSEERQKAFDLLKEARDKLSEKEIETQQKVSKEEFDNYELLRINFPYDKCRKEKPRFYEDYLTATEWSW